MRKCKVKRGRGKRVTEADRVSPVGELLYHPLQSKRQGGRRTKERKTKRNERRKTKSKQTSQRKARNVWDRYYFMFSNYLIFCVAMITCITWRLAAIIQSYMLPPTHTGTHMKTGAAEELGKQLLGHFRFLAG